MILDKSHTTKPLDCHFEPKMVADAIKEELMFMRKPQVYHEVSSELPGQVWVECHRNSMGLDEQGWCCGSIHPSPTGCARNQESGRVDTR